MAYRGKFADVHLRDLPALAGRGRPADELRGHFRKCHGAGIFLKKSRDILAVCIFLLGPDRPPSHDG